MGKKGVRAEASLAFEERGRLRTKTWIVRAKSIKRKQMRAGRDSMFEQRNSPHALCGTVPRITVALVA